jgi:hypothetical protein
MIGTCSVFMHKVNDQPNFSNQNVIFPPFDAKFHKQSALVQF